MDSTLRPSSVEVRGGLRLHTRKKAVKSPLAVNEFVDVLEKKEFSKEILENEKDNINLIIEKLSRLEKTSREKLSWAKQFSEYLQANTNTK